MSARRTARGSRVPRGVPSAAAFAALALAPRALSADPGLFDVVSQTRGVSVDVAVREDTFASCIPLVTPGCLPDTTTTQSFQDSDSAPGQDPFVATASAPGFSATSASQDSEITP